MLYVFRHQPLIMLTCTLQVAPEGHCCKSSLPRLACLAMSLLSLRPPSCLGHGSKSHWQNGIESHPQRNDRMLNICCWKAIVHLLLVFHFGVHKSCCTLQHGVRVFICINNYQRHVRGQVLMVNKVSIY